MTAPPDLPPPDPAEVAQGRRQLRWILLALLALVGITVILALREGDPKLITSEFLWWVATAVLLWNVWRGSVWSWRIATFLCFAAGLLQLLGGLFVVGWLGWFFALRGLAFTGLGLYLVADGPVRRSLEAAWAARRTDAGQRPRP